jgi:protein TonB
MTEPLLAVPDLPRRAALRETVIAALMLSAAAHAAAVYWAISAGGQRDAPIPAGGMAAVEVLLVQGPSEQAASAEAPADTTDRRRDDDAVRPAADRAVAADSLASTPFTQPQPAASSAVQQAPTPRDAAPAESGGGAVAAPPPPPPKPALAEPPAAAPAQIARAEAPPPARAADDAAGDRVGAAGDRAARDAAEGDQAAAPLAGNPAPDYPYAARLRGERGRVLLRVEVTPGGDAGVIAVERSSGYAALDRAASQAVRRWRFRPARQGGAPVAATVQVPVRFDLQ